MKRIIITIIMILWFTPLWAQDNHTDNVLSYNNGAVILSYQYIDHQPVPQASLDRDIFIMQLEYLKNNNFNVISLKKMIDAFDNKQNLPPKSVVITFDSTHRNFYDVAMPLLKQYNIPFSLFITVGFVGAPNYMNWDMIREISLSAANGTSIESQSLSYSHLALLDNEQLIIELGNSRQKIKKEIGLAPLFFAYPYGETSLNIMDILQKQRYRAAFGQHSGAASAFQHKYYLPRFSINNRYGNIDNFAMRVHSLPLAIGQLLPRDPYLSNKDIDRQSIGFNILDPNIDIEKINCFRQSFGEIKQRYLIGKQRLELRLDSPFTNGRNRVNCTYLDKDKNWHWYGMMYHADILAQ